MKNKLKILFPVLFIVVIGFFLIKPQKQKPLTLTDSVPVVNIYSTVTPSINEFGYQGVDGIDALTLLKQKTSIKQDSAGMVVSISNRQADSAQREFWSFYINGQSAQVGPASYITKNNDIISWKIEKY